MSDKQERALREAARNRKYVQSRDHLFKIVSNSANDPARADGAPLLLNQFLERDLFRLSDKDWIALVFNRKDWGALNFIRHTPSKHLDKQYLYFLRSYVVANAPRIIALHKKSAIISSALLLDEPETITRTFLELDAEDQQSLYSFRLVSALLSREGDTALKNYFNAILRTDWLRKRFLYPLVYHALNHPTDRYFDSFLDYVLSGQEEASERATIRFLLRDDLCREECLAFKAYVGLLCHPYDACEILLNHIELEFAAHGTLSVDLADALQQLQDAVPIPRIAALADLLANQSVPFTTQPNAHAITARHDYAPTLQRFLANFCMTSPTRKPFDGDLPPTLGAFERMRNLPYPVPTDFDHVTQLASDFRFTEAGRLLGALLTSIYMIPRADPVHECRDLLRLTMFLGELCPFIVASPSGSNLLSLTQTTSWKSTGLESDSDLQIDVSSAYSDRFWIKAVHWKLRDAQRLGRISEWLTAIRQNVRVQPRFLTGIDWNWFDGVLRDLRLKPFANPTGAYSLLLAQVEDNRRKVTALRSALEQSISPKSVEHFVQWLMDEYGPESTAFVRYFLTPDNIMRSHLAPNDTAAIASRVFALEACVQKYGFSEMLTSELFEQEAKTLTAALHLLNVNSGQFEIPWGAYRRDVISNHADLYDAVVSLSTQHNSLPLLSKNRITTPHRFSNGRIEKYTLQNVQWPAAKLALTIIDDFSQHSSFGLEVLLSTRFRHDAVRRELMRAVDETNASPIANVPDGHKEIIINQLSSSLPQAIDGWLDRRMHTKRDEKPDGLFDLVPTPEELTQLVTEMSPMKTFEEIINHVAKWIRAKLDIQLSNASAIFNSEFRLIVHNNIVAEAEKLSPLYRPEDKPRVLAAVDGALGREISRLLAWFRGSDAEERPALTFRELKLATDGLFENEITSKVFSAHLSAEGRADRPVPPEHVRLCFDILRNLYTNAAKHSQMGTTRVRISHRISNGMSGFLFSNPASKTSSATVQSISGMRHDSATDAILREGNSGLAKIAALAATLIDRDVTLTAIQKEQSFHVFVPFWNCEKI